MFQLNAEIHFTLILLLIPLLNIDLYNRNEILFHPCHHCRDMYYVSILTLLSWRLSPCTATHRNNHFHPYYHGTYTILQLYYSSTSFSHFVFGYYDPVLFSRNCGRIQTQTFSIILFLTYHTSYTNFDLVHSFTGFSFKFKFGATQESKSPPSDRRSAVKLNGVLFPSFSLLTVAYRPSLHTSRHYSSHTRWSNILSLPRRGIFTAHSLLFSAIFTAHIWQH